MKILGLGVPELVIILVVVLLIFGPKNLPKLGASLGKTVKSLREGMAFDKKDDEEVEEIIEIVEDEPSGAGFVSTLPPKRSGSCQIRPAPLLFVLPDAVHFVGCSRR